MTFLKKLAHAVVRLACLKFAGWARDQGRANTIVQIQRQSGQRHRESWNCSLSPKAICFQNSILLRGSQSFVLLRPSTDYKGPTHIMEKNLFHSKPINLNVNHIQKCLHRKTQNKGSPHIWTLWPSTPYQLCTKWIFLNHTQSPNKDNNKVTLTPNMTQLFFM